jgi:PhnB protein
MSYTPADPGATTVQPYLFFGGRCDEALAFYRATLGAEVDVLMRFDESPDPVPAGMLAPGFEKKVMHCSLRIGGTSLMASDGQGPGTTFGGFALTLSVPTAADADRVFARLSGGGTVQMPLGETFFSPRFGMLVDRFGVPWMVIVPAPVAA